MTRMKIAKYIPAAAIALVLAGCQSEDDFVSSDYANDPMAVHIRAGIEALQTRVNTAGAGDAWEDGDLISVANTSAGAVSGNGQEQGGLQIQLQQQRMGAVRSRIHGLG